MVLTNKAIAENKNAIVASCWTYFTTGNRPFPKFVLAKQQPQVHLKLTNNTTGAVHYETINQIFLGRKTSKVRFIKHLR